MLQNRVNPWGQLQAVTNYGTLMGNRGILHNESNEIIRPWAHKHWVTCLLHFKDIKRPKPFSAGNYSELFFLDEVTAFSAGHRPCAFCQRERNALFKGFWLTSNVQPGTPSNVSMEEIDNVLHGERTVKGGGKRTYESDLNNLPIGTMFERDQIVYAVGKKGYRAWSFSGYGPTIAMDGDLKVKVLTPPSIVQVFSAGFTPLFHPSFET